MNEPIISPWLIYWAGQDRVYTSGLLCSWLRSDCICRGGCNGGLDR